nr:hypothetical protein [Nocardia wallacei]
MRGLVDIVSERPPAAFPEPFRCFALHPIDDAVDDGVTLELGEHAEHLHEHASHGGGGVEWFGGRAEHHIGLFEFVEQRNHVAQIAGESIHPIHQQDVDMPVAGRPQCSL